MPQFGGAVGEELFQRRVALHGAGYGIHECHSDRRAFKHRPELRFAPSQRDLRLFALGDICQHPEHARDFTGLIDDRAGCDDHPKVSSLSRSHMDLVLIAHPASAPGEHRFDFASFRRIQQLGNISTEKLA